MNCWFWVYDGLKAYLAPGEFGIDKRVSDGFRVWIGFTKFLWCCLIR